MPLYMDERTFPDGLGLPVTEEGESTAREIVARNAELGVTWIHFSVNEDRTKTFCVYYGPDPEAIRRAA